MEFRLRGILYTQQERHRVMYKGEVVGEYVPDLLVQAKLIVDTKTIERITDHQRGQMLNYLRITGLPAGVILNFKHARLEWERLVLTSEPRMNANEYALLSEPKGIQGRLALRRLVNLCEAWNKPDRAASYRALLSGSPGSGLLSEHADSWDFGGRPGEWLSLLVFDRVGSLRR